MSQQGDLFEFNVPLNPSGSKGQHAFLESYKVSLRFDQFLLGVIGIIILGVFLFSIGVEKGKRSVGKTLYDEQQKQELLIEKVADQKTQIQVLNEKIENVSAAKILNVLAKEQKLAKESKTQLEETKKYTIQIVTYKTDSAAQRQIGQLKEKGLAGFVIPSGDFLQVCANSFENRQAAQKMLQKLKADGIAPTDAYIRTIPV